MALRIVGVDPGLTRCGLAAVDVAANRQVELVGFTVAGTPTGTPLDARLLAIAEAIDAWLELHQPDVLALERVFASANVSTVIGTAQVTGIVILAAARRGIPVALHTPTEVKAAVTGSGQATKVAIGKMVAKICRLDEPPKPADAADAVALAIAHGWRGAAVGSNASASATAGRVGSNQLTAAQQAWIAAEASSKRRATRR
ncbi:crossover junction endodeoxyribonuclease RuvC [Arthrobacter sp. MYb211]|uniref:crossover junction endodeoxyribonuclease RuvC n=1 Tax=unclassified Arthrobacter TaxID=235627 RepID=UPI000CFC077B|nr:MULTISPECIES: crossover junction endodeoxyribonuclease RuvC [unclassified Arthrobacter]PRA06645.1 crossover junction endodeoxyribonuclease RuvC [Arthrobacter sp. MYb229]PRA13791.1 crossover junction endodeoxyribonuclease RuvC [Arthrobacter sp. MYb221]PRB53546.1 crossover junction endodeoxyribonuclease RuvC [Arthrobacter sp. MYb216]PRC09161.1 crossover junction endodeoxyribonuclease RuvC [Arthrobacter sp. MYb211]